jgi:hypothetical protein
VEQRSYRTRPGRSSGWSVWPSSRPERWPVAPTDTTVEPTDLTATTAPSASTRSPRRSGVFRRRGVPPDGGLVVYNESREDDDSLGSVIDVSDYLDPSVHEIVLVDIAGTPGSFTLSQALTTAAHRDIDRTFDHLVSDGVDDGAYLADGAPVSDASFVVLDPLAQPVYWQTDLVAGEPYDCPGPESGDDFYADPQHFEYAREAGTVSITFTVAEGCANLRLTLALYEKLEPGFDRSMEQVLLASETGVFGPGTTP